MNENLNKTDLNKSAGSCGPPPPRQPKAYAAVIKTRHDRFTTESNAIMEWCLTALASCYTLEYGRKTANPGVKSRTSHPNTEHKPDSIYQPKNGHNKLQLIASINLLHVPPPGCHPQGVLEQSNYAQHVRPLERPMHIM
jgi:hypothetical protein